MKCLKLQEVVTLPEEFDTYVVDLSVEIRSKACLIKSNKYAYRQFVALVLKNISYGAKRAKVRQTDVVVDFYYNLLIKSGSPSLEEAEI